MEESLGRAGTDRREFLSKYGKAALVAPPVITMLLSTSMSSPAIAQSTGGGPSVPNRGPHGNNGVGNGDDPQPPGNPPINDGSGSGPGNPGNNHGHHGSDHSASSHGRHNN